MTRFIKPLIESLQFKCPKLEWLFSGMLVTHVVGLFGILV
jgi:hypothetical protein